MQSAQVFPFLVVAFIPGAMYVWTFERQVGRWGIGVSDRVLRFVGGSCVFHIAFAPSTYWLWADQWPRVRDAAPVGWGVWAVVAAYVAVPAIAGTTVGAGTRRAAPWARWFTGKDPAPRAWDYVFQHQVDGWVRLRLKSGAWIGGAYAHANGRRSYASGYPEPQDLFLAAAIELDPETGVVELDADGRPVLQPRGLLVRWEEVEYLEITDV